LRVIVDTALPFFALLLCGYLAVRWRLLDAAAARGINAFVFWMALPALLLKSVAAAPLPELLDPRLLGVFYGVNACLYALTFAVGRAAWGDPPGTAALRSLGVIWGNYGYLGLPLLTAALGPQAALPAVAVVTFDILVPASLTIALLEADRGGRRGLAGLGAALGGVARNPLIAAVAVGAVFSAAAVPLPAAAANFLAILGGAAGPCALVALGASLALSPAGGARRDVSLVAGLKLLANPLLVWLAGAHLLPLEPDKLAAVVLLAAMPTAASVFVIAQRYETWVLRASTSVLATHLGSVATLGLLLYLFSR
jgi:malonate transporter and related proteins